jgi:hypothetical protein
MSDNKSGALLERVKTTVYLDSDNEVKLRKILPKQRNQRSTFINQAVREKIDAIEKQKLKEGALNALHELFEMRVPSNGVLSVDLIKEVRHERAESLYNLSQKNAK